MRGMSQRQRVLLLSVSAGTGHVRAAQALEKAFARDERVATVRNEDALKFTNKLFHDAYSKLYMQLVRSAPDVEYKGTGHLSTRPPHSPAPIPVLAVPGAPGAKANS
jgi:hypothetical protein